MQKYLKKHKKIIYDFLYSFVAYALPTIVLQFVVQPLIASQTSSDDNGLFVALFNVIKLMIGIFIMPLANLRLLKKQDCEKTAALNAFFNYLFIIAVFCTTIIGGVLSLSYKKFAADVSDIVRLLAIMLLMSIHDYFMISFRLVLNYKKIVIDNILIVAGYGIGMYLFTITGMWELIFICGYLNGSVYVLLNTDLWKTKPNAQNGKHLIRQYGELSASDLLKNASTYCDRLIIYPVLGGFDVSVYNAAAVVSKAISVVSSPLRNVLLSYIVNHNGMTISRKKVKRFIPLAAVIFSLIFLLFWAFSAFVCKYLYPKYAISAMPFIPIIVVAIMIETAGSIFNIALLRFAKTKIQTIISAIKLGVYILTVILLAVVVRIGLWGFCIAILVADVTFIIAVLMNLRKNIRMVE